MGGVVEPLAREWRWREGRNPMPDIISWTGRGLERLKTKYQTIKSLPQHYKNLIPYSGKFLREKTFTDQ